MEFEWDEKKHRANLATHGIDFEDAIGIWDGPVLEVSSPQTHHGEERILAIGRCEDVIITIVFTWRGKRRRLISARKARRNERENYHKALEGTSEG
jgi:uncharacterized protein